jgi:Gly-Xaa carboxypeptidase
VPRRTIILSHGNDEEEVFARRGQGHIAPFLEERYGKDGLLMVIDEGSGNQDNVGYIVASAHGVAEHLRDQLM